MDITSILTIGAIISIGVGAGAAFYYYKKRNVEKFFNQVYQEIRMVPKQKKNSFLLLLFKESLQAATKKSGKNSFATKLQNPKFLDIQLVQMSNILKDPSKVQDKIMKRSLDLLNNYLAWEKAKLAEEKKAVESKAS